MTLALGDHLPTVATGIRSCRDRQWASHTLSLGILRILQMWLVANDATPHHGTATEAGRKIIRRRGASIGMVMMKAEMTRCRREVTHESSCTPAAARLPTSPSCPWPAPAPRRLPWTDHPEHPMQLHLLLMRRPSS